MSWLVIIRSRHDYSEHYIGYEISSIRCESKGVAAAICDWLSKNTRDQYVRTAVIEDKAP
jgi:hypothetical protein